MVSTRKTILVYQSQYFVSQVNISANQYPNTSSEILIQSIRTCAKMS